MAQTPESSPENSPIEISYIYPNLKLKLTLKADHPMINHATSDERFMIRSILGSIISETLRVIDSKPDIELIGSSVLDELLNIQRLSDVIRGRMEEIRLKSAAKQFDEVWAARK